MRTFTLFFYWKPDPNKRRSKQKTFLELLNFRQRQFFLQFSRKFLKRNDKRTRRRFCVRKIVFHSYHPGKITFSCSILSVVRIQNGDLLVDGQSNNKIKENNL